MSIRFRCPHCGAGHDARELHSNAACDCQCGRWCTPAGDIPQFLTAAEARASDDRRRLEYFRNEYHERWRQEQVAFDADPQHDRYRQLCFGRVRSAVRPGSVVLEVGAGLGHFLNQLPRGVERHAVDVSLGNLQYIKNEANDERLGVWNASAEALPFENDQFDITYSFSVLWYVRHWRAAVRELIRVTRPGGTIVFDVYNGWSPWRRWHHLYARMQTMVTRRDATALTYACSPRALMRLLAGNGCEFDIEGYYAILPTTFPPFGARGKLAQRSDLLSFGLARGPLKWSGTKLLICANKHAVDVITSARHSRSDAQVRLQAAVPER